jgi:glycerophosphoryl diester phosphodiesterase
VVAHRAGNDLAALRRAERVRPALVEADVHLFAGRPEVRHLKTLGPVPILWDRWRLAPPRAPRLTLGELLEAADRETELMLDLKGRDARLCAHVAEALRRHRDGVPTTVCSRTWALLEPLRAVDGVRLVHSAGSRRQLAALLAGRAGARLDGVSVHRRLLDPAQTLALRERAALLLCWPVATVAEARALWEWGVQGVITEQFEAISAALAPGAEMLAAA